MKKVTLLSTVAAAIGLAVERVWDSIAVDLAARMASYLLTGVHHELILRTLYAAEVMLAGLVLWRTYKMRPTGSVALSVYVSAVALYYLLPAFAPAPAPLGAVWGQSGRTLMYLLMSASIWSVAARQRAAPPIIQLVGPAAATAVAGVVLVAGETQMSQTANGSALLGCASAAYFGWTVRNRLSRPERWYWAVYTGAQLLHPVTLFSADLAVNNVYFAVMLIKFCILARVLEGGSTAARVPRAPADRRGVFYRSVLSTA